MLDEKAHYAHSSFQNVLHEMASLGEVKLVVHHTHYPYMQGVVVVNFEMHDTFKATKVVVPQINVVEAY